MGHKLGERRAEKVEEVRKAYEAMMPVEDIMKTTGLSRSFIYTVRRELGLEKRTLVPTCEDRPDEQRCPSCKTWKPHNAFLVDTTRKTGRSCYCHACQAEKFLEHRERDRIAYLLYSTRQSAKLRGLTHTITAADLTIPTHCPVLGIPLHFTHGERTDNSPSVDRLDNDRGYEPGNVLVVSFRANVLRRDATSDELRRLAAFYATP